MRNHGQGRQSASVGGKVRPADHNIHDSGGRGGANTRQGALRRAPIAQALTLESHQSDLGFVLQMLPNGIPTARPKEIEPLRCTLNTTMQ